MPRIKTCSRLESGVPVELIRPHRNVFFLFICIALPTVAASAAPNRQPPQGILFQRDIVYGKGGDEDLKLDLSRLKPASTHPAIADQTRKLLPCIIVIHGGGWSAGSKEDHDDLTWNLAARGFVAATINYRLAPAHPFPAQIEDAKCAVRFLRAHAPEYGIDPKHIGAVGFSAGAHLSLMLAVARPQDHLEGEGGSADQSSAVQAAVSFSGPTDLNADDLPPITHGILQSFLGGPIDQKRKEARAASPITYLPEIGSLAPPILLFQGTVDPLVPVTQAYHMLDAMTAAGAPGRAEIVVGAGHGFARDDLFRAAEETFVFFERNLKH